MKQSIAIALKDLRLLAGNRSAWVDLILVPLIFITVWSGGFEGLSSAENDQRIPLTVVNLDDGDAAAEFLTAIEEAGGIRLEEANEEEAMDALRDHDINRALVIPAGFSEAVSQGKQATARMVTHPEANFAETETVSLIVSGAAQDMQLERQLVASLEQMMQMQGATGGSEVFTTERVIQQASSQFEASQERPLLIVERVEARREEAGMSMEDVPEVPGTNISVPGLAILFVFTAAQATARSIFAEKRTGSFRRLLAAPLSKTMLMVGKMLPNFVTVIAQFVIIFGAAILLLPLIGLERMTLGKDLVALGLLVILVALCCTSLGVLIAAIAGSEGQIGGLSTLVLWGFGLVGGALVPPFLLPSFLQSLGRLVPHSWAITGFNQLLVFGGGLSDIWPQLGALLFFAALFGAIGIWRFDYN